MGATIFTRMIGSFLVLALTAGTLPAQPVPRFAHEGALRQLKFSADGKRLAAITAKGIVIWDAATGAVVRHLAPSETNLLMDYSPSGDELAVYHGGGEIGLWNVASGKRRRLIEIAVEGEALTTMYASYHWAMTPDGRTLATATEGKGAIQFWDVVTGASKTAPIAAP